jgi:hypothetical protein
MTTRTKILETAAGYIDGPRANDYGSAQENFSRIGTMWGAILGTPNAVSAEEVAMCLVALKLSRLANTPSHEDSWVDLAGYAALGGEIGTEK